MQDFHKRELVTLITDSKDQLAQVWFAYRPNFSVSESRHAGR